VEVEELVETILNLMVEGKIYRVIVSEHHNLKFIDKKLSYISEFPIKNICFFYGGRIIVDRD
jgi:hypothetical protein